MNRSPLAAALLSLALYTGACGPTEPDLALPAPPLLDTSTMEPLVAETLGEHVFDFFLRNKRAEWDEYRAQVTPWELENDLPVL